MPITIENLVDPTLWKEALDHNWLSPRSQAQMRQILLSAIPSNKSFDEFQKDLLEEVNVRPELLTHTVRNESKNCFCQYAIEMSESNPDIFKEFYQLISTIEAFFKQDK